MIFNHELYAKVEEYYLTYLPEFCAVAHIVIAQMF